MNFHPKLFYLQLHLTRMAKESIECTFADNVNAAEKRAELREAELNTLVDSLQAKHGLYFEFLFVRRSEFCDISFNEKHFG